MKKKATIVKQNTKHKISQEKLHGMSLSLISNALWVLLGTLALFVGIIGAQQMYSFGYKVFDREERDVDSAVVEITIDEGADVLTVGEELEENGIIDSAYVFFAQSVIFDLDVLPGTYEIDIKSSSREILETFNDGPESTT